MSLCVFPSLTAGTKCNHCERRLEADQARHPMARCGVIVVNAVRVVPAAVRRIPNERLGCRWFGAATGRTIKVSGCNQNAPRRFVDEHFCYHPLRRATRKRFRTDTDDGLCTPAGGCGNKGAVQACPHCPFKAPQILLPKSPPAA